MTHINDRLRSIRRHIDDIDDQMIELLTKRIGYVHEVAALKTQHMEKGVSFIRPGREAMMLRRISGAFDEVVIQQAVAHIWRMIISSAINLEEQTQISAVFSSEFQEGYWLAREYFGAFTGIKKRMSAADVVDDVYSRNCSVGMVSYIAEPNNAEPWWSLLVEMDNYPTIFATIPFVYSNAQEVTPWFALGYAEPEATGEDGSLWVVQGQTEQAVHAAISGLEVRYREVGRYCTVIEDAGGSVVRHLIEIEGFEAESSPLIATMRDAHNVDAFYIGAYAKAVRVEG